jgi:hypothetical protein
VAQDDISHISCKILPHLADMGDQLISNILGGKKGAEAVVIVASVK